MQFFFHKALINPPQELSKDVKNNNDIPMHATKQQAYKVLGGEYNIMFLFLHNQHLSCFNDKKV
jgi:hypothetical protein